MADKLLELILYACPEGELARQLDAYFEQTRIECGANAAHSYPPHITLIGFFHDKASSLTNYVDALNRAMQPQRSSQQPILSITKVSFDSNFHGMEIDSARLRQITADFAAGSKSSTRDDTLRLKNRLHLSLAYKFRPEHAARLEAIGRAVNEQSTATWKVCLFERFEINKWHCHAKVLVS